MSLGQFILLIFLGIKKHIYSWEKRRCKMKRYHNTEFKQGDKSIKKGNTYIQENMKYVESIEKCWR